MRLLLGTLALALAVPLAATTAAAGPRHQHGHHPRAEVSMSTVDDTQGFRGLDAVSRRTAWVAGGNATEEGGPGAVWRTTDGGKTWQDVSPVVDADLAFRDVEARGRRTAVVLAIGAGDASRAYRTDDGGDTWTETFRNQDDEAFFNCMDFYPGGRRGLAVSDSVDGKFRIIATEDGGRSWEVLPDEGMPDSTGEFNFSASGDCLVIVGRHVYFGSGGAASRVFHSADGGLTWDASESTIPTGAVAGVFGLAFKDPRHGVAVGGDFDAPGDGADASAYTRRTHTWTSGGDLTQLGEDAAWLPGTRRTLVVVGESGETGGIDVSRDGGRTWSHVSDTGFHTLDCTRDRSCWAAGEDGRVGRVSWKHRHQHGHRH